MKRVKGFDVPVDRINPLTRIDIYIDTFQFWMLVLFSLFPDEVWAISFIKQMPPEHLRMMLQRVLYNVCSWLF